MTVLRRLAQGLGRGTTEPIRLLIADDEAQVRRVLRRTFENDDRFMIVGEAHDGADAVDQVASAKPDVLILDLAMPNTNGMEAIPKVRQASPDTKIVVFSNWAGFAEMGAKANAEGAALVIDKFTPPRKLVKAVLRVADRT